MIETKGDAPDRPCTVICLKLGRELWLSNERHAIESVDPRSAVILRRERDGAAIEISSGWRDIGLGVKARLGTRHPGGRQANVLFSWPFSIHVRQAKAREKMHAAIAKATGA